MFDLFHHINLVPHNSIIMLVSIFIILTKFVSYYSQYYAGIIGSGLPYIHIYINETQACS